jgi:NADH:quinone reductase (non-electrogenic)
VHEAVNADRVSSSRDAGPPSPKIRIVILGGGFGGAYTARHLEKLFRGRPDVEVVLISRDNFFVMTPLLFGVCSGTLEMRHVSVPIRAFLRSARFAEATVRRIDLDRRVVHTTAEDGDHEVPYDHLVLALGSITNRAMIPGSEHAFTFKTLADAFVLRNHLIERFERADVETDPAQRRRQLTFVVIGGGLVGVELFGELTAFVDEIARLYPHVGRDEFRFVLLQGGDRLMPEIDPALAEYGARVLGQRVGAQIRTHAAVQSIAPGQVHLKDEVIEADTVVLAAGVLPSPVVSELPVDKDRRGHIIVEATMRSRSHPEVWALGDCALIPGPDGQPYPTLAQHALREAKVLASNLHAVVNGRPPQPFVYKTKGMMGSLGHTRGFAQAFNVRLRGRLAWWVRRTYYLHATPGWVRRLRLAIDWTFALLFRPDVVKVDLDREHVLLLRGGATGTTETKQTNDDRAAARPADTRPMAGRPV